MTTIAFDPNAVLNPDHRITEVLLGLMGWARKTYVYPSQLKIRELLRSFTGRTMSLRTLNRHLKALERDGQLRRLRRLAERPEGVLHIRTTIYFPSGRWLARAQRLTRGLAGWARASSQRDASRKVPTPANNLQSHTAVGRVGPVDNPPT